MYFLILAELTEYSGYIFSPFILYTLRATACTEHGTTVFSICSSKSVMPQALFKQCAFISNKDSQLISWSKIRSPESIQVPLLTVSSKIYWY